MGEKDDGLGLGLGLGLSLSLGCGGNLQTSVKMNPMQNKQPPSQMVQNHDKKSSPWNEMFQFPGNLSVFCSYGFYFSLSKFRICFQIRSIRIPFYHLLHIFSLQNIYVCFCKRMFKMISLITYWEDLDNFCAPTRPLSCL